MQNLDILGFGRGVREKAGPSVSNVAVQEILRRAPGHNKPQQQHQNSDNV